MPNPQIPTDLSTFTEGNLNEKLNFLCSVNREEKGAFQSLEPWNICVLTIHLFCFCLNKLFSWLSWTGMADISGWGRGFFLHTYSQYRLFWQLWDIPQCIDVWIPFPPRLLYLLRSYMYSQYTNCYFMN